MQSKLVSPTLGADSCNDPIQVITYLWLNKSGSPRYDMLDWALLKGYALQRGWQPGDGSDPCAEKRDIITKWLQKSDSVNGTPVITNVTIIPFQESELTRETVKWEPKRSVSKDLMKIQKIIRIAVPLLANGLPDYTKVDAVHLSAYSTHRGYPRILGDSKQPMMAWLQEQDKRSGFEVFPNVTVDPYRPKLVLPKPIEISDGPPSDFSEPPQLEDGSLDYNRVTNIGVLIKYARIRGYNKARHGGKKEDLIRCLQAQDQEKGIPIMNYWGPTGTGKLPKNPAGPPRGSKTTYKCVFCDFTHKQAFDVAKHIEICPHNPEPFDLSTTKEDPDRDKRTCEYCGKEFVRPSKMVHHRDNHCHTNPTNWVPCHWCDLNMSRNGLEQHESGCKANPKAEKLVALVGLEIVDGSDSEDVYDGDDDDDGYNDDSSYHDSDNDDFGDGGQDGNNGDDDGDESIRKTIHPMPHLTRTITQRVVKVLNGETQSSSPNLEDLRRLPFEAIKALLLSEGLSTFGGKEAAIARLLDPDNDIVTSCEHEEEKQDYAAGYPKYPGHKKVIQILALRLVCTESFHEAMGGNVLDPKSFVLNYEWLANVAILGRCRRFKTFDKWYIEFGNRRCTEAVAIAQDMYRQLPSRLKTITLSNVLSLRALPQQSTRARDDLFRLLSTT